MLRLYTLGIFAKIFHLFGGKMSFPACGEELTFKPALCYNLINNETRMNWQLTVSGERRGANFIVFADRLGSSICERIELLKML